MNGIFSSKDDGCMPSLSLTQRMYGFGACFVIGGLMSVMSSFSLVRGDIPQFAVLYSLGNVIALLSTGFVWGPKTQCKKMWKETRAIATGVYLVCIVATLTVATLPETTLEKGAKTGICITLIIIQFIALCWYCLSYIPYARSMVKNCVGMK